MGASFWLPCKTGDLEKCSIAGALFTSFATSENVVGIIAAFGLILSLQGFSGRVRIASVLIFGMVVLLSGSRTAYVTLIIALSWHAVSSLIERQRKVFRIPFPVGLTLGVAAASAAMFLIYTAEPESFSRRGRIWIAVSSQVDDQIVTGIGLSKWVYFQTLGEAPDHFFHSGYALLYFSGGLVALLLSAVVLAGLLAAESPLGRGLTEKSLVVLFATYSFTETIWNPLAVDTYSWIVIGIFLTAAATPSDRLFDARKLLSAQSKTQNI
ncbi:O-antigen ligase family protein [Actinomycetospora sp. NBRC 106378]|uniref:O-antigen ligase family protein n=1 Tax=Actinomycetospora sp. NBRC 106378 TaxID=3032208 RepID=UPI0025570A3A|nr:O-antigen ligase family protein [Actinomycetospora sp. NBRC 106378]